MLKHFALALTVGLCTVAASAQTDIKANPDKSAYVQDGRGVIARNPFGLCWRTGYWTPADAVAGCDGELAPPVAKPTAPAIAAPAPVAAAAPVAPKRCDFAVTLGADQTFEFNKAVLNSAAKKRIDDEAIAKLGTCSKVDIVMVTGHTDRIGTHQYNQKLSEKRADAVAAYLKSKGVTAEIDTLGAGKTQSIKACDDKLPRKQQIECLAPNRRVVIEVRGLAN
ncbi:OmpA family protein [Noviherbaspirillum denitrificans]|uniref:Cell envelope biogenesis protein OmpA n=1 Tax=Noviherbaspirillum denitrificans TaxID=1968433 RepID=A0A254TF63_9BURK|nr:OmpA family protein [Noviherbaspirillum denitrificans]OWW19193.1 cell envelope biogenesis protein OmpA [Noviherbaspirillum denitrificans]